MIAVQSKSPSLAGMITIDNVSSAPIFTNLGAVESLGTNQNETNIDVSSRLITFYIPQLQGCTGDSHSAKESAQCGGSEHRLNICPMFESYIAVIPAFKQYRNRDLYGEFTGDVLKSQDIEKRSTYSCIAQKVDEKKGSISNSTLSKHLKWDCHYHLDNNADAKIITSAYCQQSKPCYISLAAAKSADGRRNPNQYKATIDAISVFFYVDATAQPFNTAKIRSVSMVALVGRRSRLPVTLYAGIPTPINVTTNQSVGTQAVTPKKYKEAATMATTPTPKPSFIWIIAAIRRDCPTIKATIHHIAAATEREARRALAKDHVCFFAGRINQGVAHA